METSFSLSPRHLLVKLLAERFRKVTPPWAAEAALCAARARASRVLPVPGGPVSRMDEVCRGAELYERKIGFIIESHNFIIFCQSIPECGIHFTPREGIP